MYVETSLQHDASAGDDKYGTREGTSVDYEQLVVENSEQPVSTR